MRNIFFSKSHVNQRLLIIIICCGEDDDYVGQNLPVIGGAAGHSHFKSFLIIVNSPIIRPIINYDSTI